MSLQSEAQAETVQAKILAKRRAMAYLSKQPVCRARRAATRLARWTWLEPSLLQQHNAVEAGGGLHASHASPDGVETVETKGYTQRATDAPPPASSLEEAHEKLERQASCQKIAKVLAERFGCHAPGKGLEDLLLAKESEVVKLQQEVTSLRSEREQLELALEAAERRIEELTVANAKAQPVPVKESPKDLVKASSAVMTVDAVLAVGVGPSHVTEPRDEVAAIRHERLQGIQSDTMREMFLGCVELLAADIYASRAHFVLELLQNADDNEYAMGVEPTARFVCEAGEEPYIAVINNEVGLTAQDLVGMCAISKSAKKDKADRTGRKGIGFKSVFAVSSCPHILSGRYTFKFDVRRDRMGYVMPSWLDEEELLCSVPMELRRLHQEGYTVIFLPIGDASEALVKEVEGHLEALDPATLLFMRRLQRIEFRRADGRSSSMQIQARGKAEGVQHEAVQMLTEAGTSGASGPSARSSHEFFVGRRWSKGGDRESQIAIALPTPAVDVPQRAFATLPLCHSGLNLCINADWDVSASRDGVHENGHNERLAEEAAQAFAEVALELGVQLWPASPVDYLGDRPPLSRFWRKVRERFIHALMHADVPCLAVEEDPDRAEPTRLVPATQALRRPPPTAVEKTAAALVSSALLEKSVQRCFVREPLPQGVQLECFAASHFARCLPSLVEAALALQSYADRVERLTQIYRAFEELLSEPRCDLATAQDRADLARHAPCWPCMSTGGSFILCASDFGAIFTEQGSTAWDLPDTVEEAQQRWRLRVLRPEAAEALRKLPSLPEIAGLRAAPRFTHLLGLTVQMHGQEDHTAIPHSSWWRSLRIMRDIWESPSSLEVEGREVDPLEEQGLQLLDPQIMRSILLVPSTAGPRHGPGVSCPLLLGEEVSCRGAKPLAEVPLELHPAKALVEALRWERFMVFGLQADSLLVQLDIHEGRRLAHHLVDPDWWLLVQAVAPDQMDLLQHYGASLKRLPYDEAGCWNLEQCLSADFAPFLHNVRLPSPNGLAAAPVLPARATHFTPKALGFLRELGVTMAVDSRTLIDRCLKPMLEQLDLAKPLDSLPNVSRVYAALVHVEEELLPELSKRIFVPGMGVQDAGSCMYLSPNLEGYGELLGKIDLQPWYPSLRELFVDRLHVTTSLSSHGCLEALRSLRGTASSEAKKLMKLVAGLLLQLYDMVRADPASHEVELSALRKEELLPVLHQSELRWLSVSSCMWLDVASTALSAVRLVSLQVHYPELQPLFVDLLDVPLVSSVEVRERLRAAAQATAEDPSALLDAYTCLDHLCKRGAEEDEDMALHYLRKDLAEVIFLPGATEASSPEACVFLPPEQRGLAERCGKQDLGRFFPTLAHYFEQLGVQRRLSPEPVLDLLRSLREGSDGLSLATAAVASLREAYGLNMCPVDLLVHFQEEPLLLVPRQAPTKKAKNWLRSADCMWYNVPSCEEVGCPAVEGSGWSGDFEEFFLEVLGVPALQADEVAARLDVLRRKHSQTDERSNGPQCQRAVVSAYLEILIALERRLDAGCQFHNPRLVHQLRERVFIPETGFVNASKCRWRQFEVQVPGSQDWYDLSEVYGAEVEASQLQRFFVYWLSVPTTLTLDEILEGLRALRSKSRLSRWTGHSQDEGPTLPRAARWYKELGRSLRKAPSSDLQVFRDEALIYVAGTERNWRKAPECLWIKPEKCPEGWSTDREELSAQYGHDPLLKEVFTERLGVPISVRFTCTSDAPVAPVALQGKPLWILDEGEVPEARNFIDTSERRPSNEVITDGEADPGSLDEEPLGTEPTAPVSEGEVSPNPDAADAAAPSPPSPPEPVEPPSLEPEENGAEQLAEPEPPEEAAKRERENTAEDGRRPYVESNVQLRGVAADGREERRRMLERLARSVKSLKDERQMISKANKVKHHSEVCVDCNPHHDLVQVGYLESPMATEVFIPVWVERSGQKSAMDRLKVSMSSQALYRFADLLMAVSSIFSVPCHRQVHIFEEDTQTVAFNSGALFFNLRFFTEECHDQSWEEAVSFWTVSFAHELAHFESPVHDRQHGRAMEMSQRAILPRIPQILARPWGAAPGSAAVAYRTWKLRATDGGLI